MLSRSFPRFCRADTRHYIRSQTTAFRGIHNAPPISDPPASHNATDGPQPNSASMTHPRDNPPANSSIHSPPPSEGSSSQASNSSDVVNTSPEVSGLPTSYTANPSYSTPMYTSPPFHTHTFFKALEKTFPEVTARSLMRATRALLVDRIGRVRREGLTVKDLDNVSLPFLHMEEHEAYYERSLTLLSKHICFGRHSLSCAQK